MKQQITIGLLAALSFSQTILCNVQNTASAAAGSRKLNYFFLEALRQKHAGRHTSAFHALLHCLEIDSTAAAVHYEISNYYLFLKNAEEVVRHLEKAVYYGNDNFDYKIALANVSRELGMNDEAAQAYEELTAKYPEKPELNYYLSELYVQKGEMPKAIRCLDVLEENIGMNESLTIRKYRIYILMGKQDEANREIQKLVAAYPLESKYPLLMGDLYLEQDNPGKAYEYYRKASQIDPHDPYYIVSMAAYYEYIHDTEAAREQITSALKDARLDIDTKLTILGRYIVASRKNKTEMQSIDALFRTLLEQHPHETGLNMLYGNYLLSNGQTEEAKFQYRIVIETSPEEETAWQQLLGISLKEEKPDDCLAISRSAQIHFPGDPEYYFYEGVALSLKKSYREALSAFRHGATLTAKEDTQFLSDFYGQIGDACYRLNERREAFEAYETALKYNEKNATVLNNYAYYLAIANHDLNKAESLSVQTIQLQPDNSTFIDTYAWIFFLRKNYTLAKFYIESAISKGGDKSAEIVDHYGDILYFAGDSEKALEQWEKALKLGKDTPTVRKKIKEATWFEDPNEQ
jgi:tetratricopeptide (TPR) repeat protein